MAETPLLIKCLTAGTAACVGEVMSFPMDTAKVRLQLQGEKNAMTSDPAKRYRGSLTLTIIKIAKEEGIRALYNGLPAGLQRQMCFCSIRLGLYEPVKEVYRPIIDGADRMAGFRTRVLAGMTTGAMAVLVAQPTEVVKVRYQGEVTIPGRPRKYSSTFQAYKIIATESGVKGLWQGMYANILRVCIVNVAEAVVYDTVKTNLIRREIMRDSVWCHFTSAATAGFTATVVASPVDVVKTRYMNSPQGQYTSALNCAATMLRKEGATAFYKGYIPFFCRVVSWNICMWLSYEKLKKMI